MSEDSEEKTIEYQYLQLKKRMAGKTVIDRVNLFTIQ
jgi:hypothetical protein